MKAQYESTATVSSDALPGVQYVIHRMSFARRLELMQRVRQLGPRLEFLRAGQSTTDQLETGIVSAEIDRLYLEWGLKDILGLEIDGELATVQTLVHSGPEELFSEAVRHVKRICSLTENEAKN